MWTRDFVLASPAADQLSNTSSVMAPLNCHRRSEQCSKFQTENSPKEMDARFKHVTTVTKELRHCYL